MQPQACIEFPKQTPVNHRLELQVSRCQLTWQCNHETSPAVTAGHSHSTAMSAHDVLADCQPDALAACLRGGVRVEQLSHYSRVDAGAIVDHRHLDLAVAEVGTHHEQAMALRLHCLQGIANEVDQHLLDLHMIDVEHDGLCEVEHHSDVALA